MVKITDVLPHSRGARAGILPGDTLLSINGHEIDDVLDYRFYLAEHHVTLTVSRNGEERSFVLLKNEYDDIGLDFATPLMDQKHRCENGCIFCFIDQLPRGLRDTLYFKDDDSRLSFLHGNYITLTNLRDHDIDRMIEMHISPINVSIHTMNPELRVKMMKNKRAGEVLQYLDRLADAGLKLRGQIVVCRGINDGKELDDTMHRLAAYYPALESVSVVTAGLTGYREGLYPLTDFTPEDCRALIEQVTAYADVCEEKLGTRLFYCSDEIYVKGDVPLPPYEKWGDFTQIENGVGMLTSFESEFSAALRLLSPEDRETERHISIATGECAADFIKSLVGRTEAVCPHFSCDVHVIKNNFFGGGVTVTGLLTGADLMDQLRGKNLGEELLLSRTMLRAEGDLFLCGASPEDVAKALCVKVRMVENDGGAFLDALLGC